MKLASKLRRIALDHQGLLRPNTFGRGKGGVLRAIEHIGYVQIDTISVVERAHHHVLRTRVANYQAAMLHRLVAEKKVFEYWFHAAAYLPMRDFRFALPRMHSISEGLENHWSQNSDKKLMREILARIRAEGPLLARDFEDTRTGDKEWWDWKPAKHALEELFMSGELMAIARDGFQKVYDLTERALPQDVDTRMPSAEEYAAHLIDTNLRAHGFASQKTFTYLRKGRAIRDAVSADLAARQDAGQLVVINTQDGAQFFVEPEALERRAPREQQRVMVLSPFDNAVIQRERGRSIFEFDYQIECYVPESKRQFGYFCLPLQYGDRLVGRVDCKAHRDKRVFEVRQLHVEKPVDEAFGHQLQLALREFATYNQCDALELGPSLAPAVRSLFDTRVPEI
ncbi:MAG: crosslink repair DNA glycosylase YcaQ family protein [Pseudomonadota bacterium]